MPKLSYNYNLLLTHQEAELLRVFLEKALKQGADLDPMYEDWTWPRERRVLETIVDALPEAL